MAEIELCVRYTGAQSNDGLPSWKVPAGTKRIRKATPTELKEDWSKGLLIEEPDGSQYWLHFDGRKERL